MYKQDGTIVRCYDSGTLDYSNISAELKVKFPWFSEAEDTGLTSQYTHEYLNEPVIRSCLLPNLASIYLDVPGQVATRIANRLFCMNSKTSVLYTTDIFTESNPSWVDQEMFIIASTKSYEEYKRPCSENLLNFTEYFFVAPDSTITSFGFEPNPENTVYSMIVVNNTIVAKRKYTEFALTPGGRSVLTPWQILYTVQARAHKRTDLIVDMYSKPYIT